MLICDSWIWKNRSSVKIIQNVCAMHMQVILCNDCEKRGTASFHWRYHKCQYCGSYNTRLVWLPFLENLYVLLARCRYIPLMIYATGTKRLQFSVDELVLSYCITTDSSREILVTQPIVGFCTKAQLVNKWWLPDALVRFFQKVIVYERNITCS